MAWAFEHPLMILLAGGVLEVLLFVGLVRTGKKNVLWVMAGVAVFFALWIVVERQVVTEREQVRAVLFEIARALERDDTEALIECVSAGAPPSNQFPSFGSWATLRDEARFVMELAEAETVNIKRDLEITVHDDKEPKLAEARFHVTVDGRDRAGQYGSHHYAGYFIVQFRKEKDGKWRVRHYQSLDPIHLN